MLIMETVKLIKKMYEEKNWSISGLSREFGYNRSTIRRYINGKEPKYERKSPYTSPKRDEIYELVKQWYTEDLDGPRKQRRTVRKMASDLALIYDYEGSYSTVKRIIRDIRGPKGEAYVPREHKMGDYLEFDFGELYVKVKGHPIKVYLHAFQLCCSNDIFGRLSTRQIQEEIFKSHTKAFEHIEGVTKHVRYDNLKQAVQKVLKGRRREENQSFLNFSKQFGFEAEFCAVGRGQEKGDVEGCVGYIRRNFLSPVPELSDISELEQLNEKLSEWCKALREKRIVYGSTKTVKEIHLLEKEHLQILDSDIQDVGIKTTGKANHYSLVCVRGVFYSVPVRYAYQRVDILMTARSVIFYHKDIQIARHNRSWEKDKQIFDPLHYLELFKKKPYALLNSKPIAQLPDCFNQFFRKASKKGFGTVKQCVEVLRLLKNYSLKDLSCAIELAISYNTYYAEGVKALLKQLTTSEPTIEKLKLLKQPQLADYKVPVVDLKKYQRLASSNEGDIK